MSGNLSPHSRSQRPGPLFQTDHGRQPGESRRDQLPDQGNRGHGGSGQQTPCLSHPVLVPRVTTRTGRPIEEIAHLNDLCDRLGMDTITAGNLCAFAIEAKRRGRIDFNIDCGQVDAIAGLLGLIASREGIGDVLARGIRHAAAAWDLEDLAIHVKGMEPPGYDPRALKGMGLAYAITEEELASMRADYYRLSGWDASG
ncbi:MAG: hypothetical protein JEZ11_11170 [Desulfobacterales bacterium]|nr:hypothetical protein [Desulfobacterales bacterium]